MQYVCMIHLNFTVSLQRNKCTERWNKRQKREKKEKTHREISKTYIGQRIIFFFSNTGLEIQTERFASDQDPLCRLFFKWLYH